MIKGDYDYLTNLAKYNVCAEHKTPLLVAWHSTEKAWVLICGRDHYPDAITREPSLTELYKQGEKLPSFIEENIKKSQRRRDMTQGKQSTAVTFTGVPAADLGTGELLVPEVVKALVEYARKYELDPGRGHVVLMYGKPYITIDGYLYHAGQSNRAYNLKSRPLREEERKEMQLEDGDHGWKAELELLNPYQYFVGIGIVTKAELEEEAKGKPGQKRYPVVAAHPWQLCQKRGEWQAMRRGFPIGETPEETNEHRDKDEGT